MEEYNPQPQAAPPELLEFVNGSVWAFDRVWRFVSANPEGEKLTGLPQAELLGRSLWEVLPELAGSGFQQQCRTGANGRVPASWTAPLAIQGHPMQARVFSSETGHWILLRDQPPPPSSAPADGTAPPVSGFEEVLRQAEDRLRRNHDTFYNLIQNNPFGVYVIDADFRLRQVSLGSQKVFRNVRPLLGRDFAEVLRCIWTEPFATEAIGRFRHTLETGVPYSAPSTVERRHDIPDVEAYDWRIERITLPDGRFGVVCYFYDLSERQRLDEALRAAKAAAEEASRTKSVFLANMSHELRTPLNAIIGYSEMVLEGGNCPDDLRPDIEKISVSGSHLLELINAVLDLAKIEAGRLEVIPTECDVEELASWCVNSVCPMAAANGNTLSLVCAPDCGLMISDGSKIRQILLNLLGNAAKFTSQGTIEVSASREVSPDGDQIIFMVQDSGIGISPEDQKQLFQDFVQLDPSATKRYRGTGLGLSISRHLCSLLGGTVSLSSIPGQGSRFTVVLPAEYRAPTLSPR